MIGLLLLACGTSAPESARDAGSEPLAGTARLHESVEDVSLSPGGTISRAYTEYGSALAAADWDGDGYDELAVGAWETGFYSEDGSTYATRAGAIYLYPGSEDGPDQASESLFQRSESESYDYLGWSLDSGGDINGDGYLDLIAGAAGRPALFVYYGSADGLDFEAEHELVGLETDNSDFGSESAGVGDVNGDGYDDVLVGAISDRDWGEDSVGAAFLYYGSADGLDEDSEVRIVAADTSTAGYNGYSVAGGDINGDGFSDIVVGGVNSSGDIRTGAVYVYYGSADGLDLDGELKLTPDSTVTGQFGAAAAVADLDNDGYAELIVGAAFGASDLSGMIYVYSGSADGLVVDSELGINPYWGLPEDRFGASVTAVPDLNGDGYTDVVVGAPGDSVYYEDGGVAYVFFGGPDGINESSWLLEVADWTYEDYLIGDDVDGGDFNGDGVGDVAVGMTGRGGVLIFHGCEDKDLDQYCVEDDCDDEDSYTHPGAAARDSGTDCMTDRDQDGYGDDSPAAGVTAGSDCDDEPYTGFGINPGAFEDPDDGIDQDCNGRELCYADDDNDGYRPDVYTTVTSSNLTCDGPGEASSSAPTGDCDDTDADVNPDGVEITGDEVDQDCDGQEICYEDDDGDGYRPDGASTVTSSDEDCDDSNEADASAPTGDCDDDDSGTHPGADEVAADGVDQDCDGAEVCYVDGDGDGYRPDESSTVSSSDLDCDDDGEADASAATGDCDDDPASGSAVNPGASEIPGDSVDQDCDGAELCYQDGDDDGYRIDTDSVVASGDLDCSDSGEAAAAQPAGDCNDRDADVNPGAFETPDDGFDQDCDGRELCFMDADADGYRPDETSTKPSIDLDCDDAGEAGSDEPASDCDDNDASAYPGAAEVPDDGIDQNCDGVDATTGGADGGKGCTSAPAAPALAPLVFGLIALARRRR